jgi:transposase-like protein
MAVKASQFRKILTSVEFLSPRQRAELLKALESGDVGAVRSRLESATEGGPVCPHCSGQEVIRWGQASGLPRWRCKGCGRTFNPLTGTSLAGLHNRDQWSRYAEALEEGDTLEKAGERCGIHRNTAHRWRRRFLKAAEDRAQMKTLKGIAEADEAFFLRSAKGQPRVRSDWGRPPRKRGGSAAKRGRSHEHVCVVIVRDRSGKTVEDICRPFDSGKLSDIIEPVLAKDAVLCSDGYHVYSAAARALEVKHEPLVQSKGERVRPPYHIQNVNNYHHRLKDWMRRFRGVSTTYLPNYLDWFRYLDELRHLTDSRKMLKRVLLSDTNNN